MEKKEVFEKCAIPGKPHRRVDILAEGKGNLELVVEENNIQYQLLTIHFLKP